MERTWGSDVDGDSEKVFKLLFSEPTFCTITVAFIKKFKTDFQFLKSFSKFDLGPLSNACFSQHIFILN